jgi:quinol monooxygenase YgiN
MSNHVAWMLELQIQDGRSGDFDALAAEMAAATKANEPGTLDYEWHISSDGTLCHLFERYADSAAAMIHIATFGEKYAGRFFEILKPVGFTLYGSPSAEVNAALAGFNPTCMARIAGFSR